MTRQSAGTLAVAAISLSLLLLDGTRAWSDDAVETIVLVRHGEKPGKGLGQLDCQGLNRALALPRVYQHVLAWHEALETEGIKLSIWRIHRKVGMSGGLFTNMLLRETRQEISPERVERLVKGGTGQRPSH